MIHVLLLTGALLAATSLADRPVQTRQDELVDRFDRYVQTSIQELEDLEGAITDQRQSMMNHGEEIVGGSFQPLPSLGLQTTAITTTTTQEPAPLGSTTGKPWNGFLQKWTSTTQEPWTATHEPWTTEPPNWSWSPTRSWGPKKNWDGNSWEPPHPVWRPPPNKHFKHLGTIRQRDDMFWLKK